MATRPPWVLWLTQGTKAASRGAGGGHSQRTGSSSQPRFSVAVRPMPPGTFLLCYVTSSRSFPLQHSLPNSELFCPLCPPNQTPTSASRAFALDIPSSPQPTAHSQASTETSWGRHITFPPASPMPPPGSDPSAHTKSDPVTSFLQCFG